MRERERSNSRCLPRISTVEERVEGVWWKSDGGEEAQ
jgi:hypothetical protein